MDLGQTFYIFLAESIIFIGILTACLHFAAKRHRNQLREVIDQINKSKLFNAEKEAQHENSKVLLEKLKEKLSKLQQQISMLEKIEVKYYALKDKYKQDIKELQDKLGQHAASEAEAAPIENTHTIAVGTTVDTDSGVDPAYLQYLNRKNSIQEANTSSERVSHEANILNQKIAEQKETIRALKDDLNKAQLDSEIQAIKNEEKDAALIALTSLEKSLNESQDNSRALEYSLTKLKKELEAANCKVETMELKLTNRRQNETENIETGNKSGIVINSNFNDIPQSEEMDAVNEDMAQALRDHEKLKQEVETLRANTTQQRNLIFVLEKEIIDLRKELCDDALDEDEQAEREEKIRRLESLLRETEGCVEVLESEVTYLQDKLNNYDKDDQALSLQQMYEQQAATLKKTQATLERAVHVRETLGHLTRLGKKAEPKQALEELTTMLMEIFDYLDLAAHLRLVTHFGDIEASNSENFAQDQIDFLAMTINKNPDSVLEAEEGFLIAQNRAGAFVKAPLTAETSLGKLRDTVNFTILIANSVVIHLEERQAAAVRQSALKRLVDAIKNKISTLSVQSRYQADEAKNIFDSLVKELSSMMKTMNMSETQTEFFAQMLGETKQRISLLLESELVVDKSFSDLLDKIEHSSTAVSKDSK